MHVDGFRFDLASALARELHEVDRLGAFFDIIHQDPVLSQVKLIAEPWDLGEGGYQVGNFPRRLGRVERQVPRHDARVLEGRRRPDRRVRPPAHRLERPVRPQRPPAARQHQLHHRARRLHAARPGQLQRQAQRGQRRGQPRRPRQQPVVELRRRGPDRRPGGATRCARASSATCSPRCCCRRACRCCSPATRSAAPSTATTTPTARTTSCRWLDWTLDAGAAPAARVHAAADRAAPRAPGVPPARLLPGPAAPRQRGVKDIVWLQARRHAR